MIGSQTTRWGLVLALWCAGLGAAAQYGKISVVFDQIGVLYPDAGTAVGFSVSLVGFLGILFGVVAGAYVSAFGYRRTIVVALWIGAAMSLLQALHPSFGLFLTSRVAEGLSHLGLVVAAPTLIAQISSDRVRGLTLTLWSTFFGVAFALLAWFGLPLVDWIGVTGLFAVHGAFMALMAMGLQWAMRTVTPPKRRPPPKMTELPALHLSIYRSPRISAPASGWIFFTMCFVSILTVMPTFIDPAIRALVIGAMPLASIVVSLTLGVWLLRYIAAVQVVQLGFAVAAIAMLWLGAMPGSPGGCMLLAAGMGLVQGASFAAVPELNNSTDTRAEANGAMAQAGNLGNMIGTPILVWVIGFFGHNGLAWVTGTFFLMGLGVHAWLATRRRVS